MFVGEGSKVLPRDSSVGNKITKGKANSIQVFIAQLQDDFKSSLAKRRSWCKNLLALLVLALQIALTSSDLS